MKSIKYSLIQILLIVCFLYSCEESETKLLSNKWTKSDALFLEGNTREGAFLFTCGNKAYIGAGWGDGYQNDFFEFDSAANYWIPKANFPGKGLSNACAFSYKYKAYIVGGSRFYNENGVDSLSDEVWQYDTQADNWIALDSFPGGKICGASAFTIGKKAYLVGGKDSTGYLKSFWEFDLETEKWNKLSDFPGSAFTGASTFIIGNKAYIVMGEIAKFLATKTMYCYDADKKEWSKKADFPAAATEGAMAFALADAGYIACGWAEGNATDQFYKYLPSDNKWINLGQYPGGKWLHGIAFTLGRKAYTGLGYGHREMWIYKE